MVRRNEAGGEEVAMNRLRNVTLEEKERWWTEESHLGDYEEVTINKKIKI